MKMSKYTSKTLQHEKIFTQSKKSSKVVDTNTFKQTYNAHKDQKFNERQNVDQSKIRATKNFQSSFQPGAIQTEKKPIRTVFNNKTNSKVFDSRPNTVIFINQYIQLKQRQRQQNTYKNNQIGDLSLSQFRDYEDYKSFQTIQNINTNKRTNNDNKNSKLQNLYNCLEINKEYLQKKEEEKQNQKTDRLNNNQQNRRLVENYCTNMIMEDNQDNKDKQIDKAQKVSKKEQKVNNDLYAVDPKNIKYAFNKKIEYMMQADQQPSHLQKENPNLFNYQKDLHAWDDPTNHAQKTKDPQFSDILGHEKAGLCRPKQRTLTNSLTDNWLNIVSKVPVNNSESRNKQPFQQRQNFLKSSMDSHQYQSQSKASIHDFDTRQYSHLDRRSQMSHKRLGDQS